MDADIRYRYASEKISNSVFFIPFSYLYFVRLGTIGKLASWLLLYPLLTFFYAFALHNWQFDTQFCLTYLLILLSTFSIYECGYIFNDVFAVEREEKPAIRLYPHNFDFAKKHIWQIVFCRILWALACLAILYFVQPLSVILWQLVLLIFIPLVFALYNHIRNKFSAFVYPFLVFSRYLPLLLLWADSPDFWEILLLMYSAFPLLNAIERFSMETYRFSFIKWAIPTESSKTQFRIIYYLFFAIVLSTVFFMIEKSFLLLLPFYVLLVYRVILALIVHYKTPKGYLKG